MLPTPVHVPSELPDVPLDAASEPLILALDIGTSSVRAALYDGQARRVAGLTVQQAHQMRSTADGGVETDIDPLFDRACACIDGVLHAAGDRATRIAAVAVDTFWHNVLAVDGAGTPLTPLFTWADTRSSAAAAQLRTALDTSAVHARTGCVLHPSYLPAKIRWQQQIGTDLKSLRYWLSFAELLTMRLFGSPTVSISMASGTGLLDQHACTWDPRVLAAIPLDPGKLSPLDDAPRSGLRMEFAARWPALARVPWFPGWGDGATSNVGSGCMRRERVAMMVGTSGAMRVSWRTDDVTIPERLWCYRIDRHRVVMGGALSNGGNLLEWLRDTLNLPIGSRDPAKESLPDQLREIESDIAALEPDGHGLIFLPFLAGERSPSWAADARGTISGLRLHTRPIEIIRAGYEAIAYRFALLHELLTATVPEIGAASHPVVASGGALLHSPAWLQIMADALSTPVAASQVPEASCRGAALLALEALGAIGDLESLPAPFGTVYTPIAANTARYAAAAGRQRGLYDLLAGAGYEGERLA